MTNTILPNTNPIHPKIASSSSSSSSAAAAAAAASNAVSSYNYNNKNKQSIIPQVPYVTSIPLNNTIESIITQDMIYKIDTYPDTLKQIEKFTNNHQDSLITFIVPTINRISLYKTVLSILNQTITSWKMIILFDGCEPIDPLLLGLLNNSRILFLSINKKGNEADEQKSHGSAGEVRNIGMKLVTTPWIGFVDDDDRIDTKYIEKLIIELNETPSLDLVIFRMIYNYSILPSLLSKDIREGDVGISFFMKTPLIKEGYLFEQSRIEDFTFLKKLQNNKKKMVISPFITYFVGNSNNINIYNMQRIRINF
jgi:hypothetical protein